MSFLYPGAKAPRFVVVESPKAAAFFSAQKTMPAKALLTFARTFRRLGPNLRQVLSIAQVQTKK